MEDVDGIATRNTSRIPVLDCSIKDRKPDGEDLSPCQDRQNRPVEQTGQEH